MAKKIVTFGEIMLRLNPEGYMRFLQADRLEVSFGGAEANVAVSLANYGMDAAFVTKLPEHEIGQCAVNDLRRYGVDVSKIVRGGSRVGIYFVEKGASQRPSKVIYDRTGSSIALARASDFNWDDILDGVDWFHFTGITPALGGEMPEICLEACKRAHAKGIMISCDLNYRNKLWTMEYASGCMQKLVSYVDCLIANEEHAKGVLGVEAEKNDDNSYVSIAKQIHDRFGCRYVALTVRSSTSADDNDFSAMLYADSQAYFSKQYRMHIVDRVGGGDSFGGGLIYSILSGYDMQRSLDFAVAAACLKHSVEHDYSLCTVAEVESLASGNADGRVQR